MAKIRRNDKREMPALNTSSLPDIIFMLLFFFMSVTSMKEVTYKVSIQNPQATELTKLEKKSLVRYIYVGTPTAEFRKQYGAETRIQLDDAFADAREIGDYIINERSSMKESDQGLMTVSIKADKETKMGIIADIKQELRRAYALKINYAATHLSFLVCFDRDSHQTLVRLFHRRTLVDDIITNLFSVSESVVQLDTCLSTVLLAELSSRSTYIDVTN